MLNCENCHHFDTIDWEDGIWYKCLMGYMFDCDGKCYDPIDE